MAKEKEENLHSGHRNRVREKIVASGLESMHDHEVLEFLLFHSVAYKDTNPLAHRLINHFGSFHGVLDASYDDLLQVEGVTPVTATFLSSMPSIFKRYSEDLSRVTKIEGMKDIAKLVQMKFFGATVEKMYMICMDGNMNVIKCTLISDGDSCSVAVDSRKVMEAAIRSNAELVIIVHNHPNKVAMASADDIEATFIVRNILSGVGIKLIDSVIVAGDSYVSLAKSEKYKSMFYQRL